MTKPKYRHSRRKHTEAIAGTLTYRALSSLDAYEADGLVMPGDEEFVRIRCRMEIRRAIHEWVQENGPASKPGKTPGHQVGH